MSLNELILYPSDPYSTFNDRLALIDLCSQIGLIGESYDLFGKLYFRSGPDFLKLIDFMRSHTIIELGPSDVGLVEVGRVDSRFDCRIRFPEFKEQPGFSIGATDKVPLCPNCSFAVADFPDIVDLWIANKRGFQWQCSQCHHTFKLHQLNWQHLAGFYRYSINIASIRYGEATPSEDLLAGLATLTTTSWSYLYLHL